MSVREEIFGIPVLRGFLSPPEQAELVAELREVARRAPPFSLQTPRGQKMSVRMTAAGRFCWYSDRSGYRYIEHHPQTGEAFPPIPELALRAWRAFEPRVMPDCCLINHYAPEARMGLHRDEDEADFGFPVVSVSLGDPALFRVGLGQERTPTKSFWLHSGDVMALAGERRLAFHGIDRITSGETALLRRPGRINLTLRRVRPA